MKNNPGLDRFYDINNKSILLLQSFLQIPEIPFIIKGCRLKPIEIINSKKNTLKLYHHWIDEYGNSLMINKKKIEIIFNDLSQNREKITTTDLYYGLGLNNILKLSKLLYFCFNKNKQIIICFIGIDSYLRSYLFNDGDWIPVSSLVLGIEKLKKIFHNIDIKYFCSLTKKITKSCHSEVEWIGCTNQAAKFINMIDNTYHVNLSSLTK